MSTLPMRWLRPLAWIPFLALIGCATSGTDSGPHGLERIVETQEIRIGTSGEQPPLTMTAQNGELFGLDVAISRVLAMSLGVEARFVQLPFGDLLDALERREVDMVMSGMTITPERSRAVTFAGVYYTSGKSLLTKDPKLAVYEDAADLDAPSFRFAVLAKSTSEEFVRRRLPRAKLHAVEHMDEGVRMVLDGKVDALIADRETCSYVALQNPDAGLIASDATFSIEPMGMAVHREDVQLISLLQAYVIALDTTGTLEEAIGYWLEDASWLASMKPMR